MDDKKALEVFSALSQETRLNVLRLLIKIAPSALSAGEIGRRFGVVQNTMSAHLSILQRSGLIVSRRQGRIIEYSADFRQIREMLLFLMRDCCEEAPEICAPLLELVACHSTGKGNA
jgi:ArsR family transcriptional regulator